MEILTGIIIGLIAGIILAVIEWGKGHLDHKRIRSMEIRYIKDALVGYKNNVAVYSPHIATIIYDAHSIVEGAQFYGKSKQEIENWFRSSGFKTLYKILISDANEKTTFTASEKWEIESKLKGGFFKNIDDITLDRFSEIEASSNKSIDIYTVDELIIFVENMPKTKGKALRLEQKIDTQGNEDK